MLSRRMFTRLASRLTSTPTGPPTTHILSRYNPRDSAIRCISITPGVFDTTSTKDTTGVKGKKHLVKKKVRVESSAGPSPSNSPPSPPVAPSKPNPVKRYIQGWIDDSKNFWTGIARIARKRSMTREEELRNVSPEEAKRMARLRIDTNQSYFDDHIELKQGSAKGSASEARLLLGDRAKPFPPLEVVSLAEPNTKVTLPHCLPVGLSLVIVSFREHARKDVDSWQRVYEELGLAAKGIDLYELSVIDGTVVASLFKGMVVNNMKKTRSPALQARTYVGECARKEDFMFTANRLIAHVFLLDPNGTIRWTARAAPNPTEVEALDVCAEQLREVTAMEDDLDRLSSNKPSKKSR